MSAPRSVRCGLRRRDGGADLRFTRAAGWLAGLGTLALAAFFVLRFRGLDLALHIYAGYLAGIGLGVAVERAQAAAPPAEGSRVRALWRRLRDRGRRPRPERPRGLEELEHAVDFSQSTAFDVHYRLRPHLRRVAEHRLAVRRGIDILSDPAAAAAVVGGPAWALVRPDREAPSERNAPGVSLREVAAAVDALEAI